MLSVLGMLIVLIGMVVVFNPIVYHYINKFGIKIPMSNYLQYKIQNNIYYQLMLTFFGLILILNGICLFYM